MQWKRKALRFVFKTSRRNASWLLSLRTEHHNKLEVLNSSLLRNLQREICYYFLLDMSFFVLSVRACSRDIMPTGLLLDSAVPSDIAVKLYVLVYDYKFRDLVSFQINPNFLNLLFSRGELKLNQ